MKSLINNSEWARHYAAMSDTELMDAKASLERTLGGNMGPHVRRMVQDKLNLCLAQIGKRPSSQDRQKSHMDVYDRPGRFSMQQASGWGDFF
jgi:hypothetical protein